MKDKIFTALLSLMVCSTTTACPVCEKQQPSLLRGITHGVPNSNWDWVIVGIALLITLYTLCRAVKLLIRPDENGESHIKQSILKSF